MKVFIDPEFSKLIPAVPEETAGELEETILADGQFLNPLILWKHRNTLLDGYRRWQIHLRHPSLKMPKPVTLDFESRQEANDWIIRHQLSKRNITEEQRRYLIGKLYLDQKPEPGRPNKPDTVSGFSERPKTSEEIANSEGVDERTVRRSAEFAESIDAIKEIAPEVAAQVLAGELKASAKDLAEFAELSKRDAKKVIAALADGSSFKAALASLDPPAPGGTEDAPREWGEGDALADVQADLEEFAKRCRELNRFARLILRCEENEITRPFCGEYSLLTLSHPLLHVARVVKNDMPVGGTPKKPVLYHEEKAKNL